MNDQAPEILDGETVDQDEPTSVSELVRYEPQAQIVRSVDMRSAATDSWTDVVSDVAKLASYIAQTDFVPNGLRGNPAATAAAILYGREIGIGPMTSLQGIAMVEGRPSQYAETMRARILQAGHEIMIDENTSSRCRISGRRKGSERWTTVEWTLDDARRAGLLRPSRSGKPSNWERYPRQMLLARATTELGRMIFADVIHGMRSVEEMQDEVDNVTVPAPAPQQTTTVQRRPAKKVASKPVEKPDTDTSTDLQKEEAPAQPPARKRAPLPKKTSQAGGPEEATSDRPGTAPEPEPGPTVEDQQAEIRRLSEERRDLAADQGSGPVETTEDARSGDADEPEISTGRDTGPKITAGQRASVIMHFKRLDVDDRDERLWWQNRLLGYEPGTVASASDLRQTEAITILQRLERLKDRDQLESLLNGQDELLGGS